MIRITVPGMPNRELSVEEDTAECILDSLAEVLGAKVTFGWTEKESDSDSGSVYVERI
jgi:hypothetical protein